MLRNYQRERRLLKEPSSSATNNTKQKNFSSDHDVTPDVVKEKFFKKCMTPLGQKDSNI